MLSNVIKCYPNLITPNVHCPLLSLSVQSVPHPSGGWINLGQIFPTPWQGCKYSISHGAIDETKSYIYQKFPYSILLAKFLNRYICEVHEILQLCPMACLYPTSHMTRPPDVAPSLLLFLLSIGAPSSLTSSSARDI